MVRTRTRWGSTSRPGVNRPDVTRAGTTRLRRQLGRAAVSWLGMAGLAGLVLASGAGVVAPAYANDTDPGSTSSEQSDIPPPKNRIVAQASASAATVSVAGQKQGTGEYVSEHDGTEEHTRGENEPALALLEDAEHVIGGGLGQDAVSDADGTSAACAGVVGKGGTIEVGPAQSCLDGGGGRIELSLGTLSDLGLGDLLDELRLPSSSGLVDPSELPTPDQLPDLKLVLEGAAITARCTADEGEVEGESSQLDLTLVGVVGAERIELLDLPREGGVVLLPDLLEPLFEQLPDELRALLDPILTLLSSGELPDLPENELLTIATDEQVRDGGLLRVNALRIAVLPPTLTEISLGSVSCGPNVKPVQRPDPPREERPEPRPEEPEDRARVPVSVPAGLPPSGGTGGAAATAAAAEPVPDWATVAVLAFAAASVGTLLHRRRRAL